MFASGQVLEHFTHGEVNAALRENTLQSIVTGQRAVVFAHHPVCVEAADEGLLAWDAEEVLAVLDGPCGAPELACNDNAASPCAIVGDEAQVAENAVRSVRLD